MNFQNLPEGWKVRRLVRVARINRDSANPAVTFKDAVFTYVDISSIDGNTGRITNPQTLLGKNAPSRARRVIHRGDIIVSTVRPNLKASALIDDQYESQVCSTGFAVLTPKQGVLDSEYLYCYVRSDPFVDQLVKGMKGAMYPAVNQADVEAVVIPLPLVEEQRKIAEILQLADDLRRKRRKANEFIGRIIRSLFIHMFGDPATNPKGWQIKRLGDVIADAQPGFAYGKWRGEGEVPQLRPYNITTDGKLDLSTLKYVLRGVKNLQKYVLERNDILFNNTNSPELVGKAAIFRSELRCVFSNHLTRIRLDQSKALPDYLKEVLTFLYSNGIFRSECQQWVNQAAINIDHLSRIRAPFPPLELQQRFAELVSYFEDKRKQMEQAAEDTEMLYQVVLRQAFTGELTEEWREANQIRWELPALTPRQKVLLAVVYYYNSMQKVAPPITVVMKHMFLLQREKRASLGYQFAPYKFGPFSKEVYEDVEALEKEMLVIRTKPSKKIEKQETAIDEESTDEVAKILESIPKGKKEAVKEVVDKFGPMGFEELLDYVYSKYPEFAVESKRIRSRGA